MTFSNSHGSGRFRRPRNLRGRVGSGQEVIKISRVESGHLTQPHQARPARFDLTCENIWIFLLFPFPESLNFPSKLESHSRAQQFYRDPSRSQQNKIMSAHYESCTPSGALGKRANGNPAFSRGTALPVAVYSTCLSFALTNPGTSYSQCGYPGARVPGQHTMLFTCKTV